MKIIAYLLGILMLASLVIAAPPMPMPVVFQFNYDGQPVENFQVELTLGQETIKRSTNKFGKIAMDVGTGSPDFPGSNTINPTANLNLNCGFEVCNKNYAIWSLDTPYEESFSLRESPPVTCPACPPCGGGGSSGIIYRCTEEICKEDYPCDVGDTRECTQEQCEKVKCPACPTIECPACEDCEEPICPEPECPDDLLAKFLVGILGFAGGGALFFGLFNNKIFTSPRTGMKTYRGRDGTLKILHKHPGTKGYHNPDIVHRKPENHPKGMVDVKDGYVKNLNGDWEYKG